MWEALREATDEEMEKDPNVCVIGKANVKPVLLSLSEEGLIQSLVLAILLLPSRMVSHMLISYCTSQAEEHRRRRCWSLWGLLQSHIRFIQEVWGDEASGYSNLR